MQPIQPWFRQPKTIAAIVAVIIACILLLYRFALPLTTSATNTEITTEDAASLTEDDIISPTNVPEATHVAAPAMIVVAITGAVHAPDAYQLPANARVKDLVLAAGGLASDADGDQINFAAKLTDTERIHIPRKGEAKVPQTNAANTSGATSEAASQLININTASTDDFESLPGIGQVLAKRIVDYRTAKGPFKSIDDLKQVKGISAALIGDIAPYIVVGS